jgi:hypothetical protein
VRSRASHVGPIPGVSSAGPGRLIANNRLWLAALLGVLGAFHILTLPTGYGWGDDFAMYIHHARNIVQGVPYGVTGYIYNPHNPGIGPPVYPPGYPLLLAPIYAAAGLDLQAMRIEIVAFLLASLALIAYLFSYELGAVAALVLVAVLGLNPSIWSLRAEILADIPFLFFCFAALLQIRRFECQTDRTTLLRCAVLGVTSYFAYATRTVGLLLVVIAVISDLWTNRRPTRASGIVVLVFGVLAVAQRLAFGATDSYLDQLVLEPRQLADVIVLNLKNYVLTLVTLLGTDPKQPIATAVTFVGLLVAGLGLAHTARRGPTAFVSFSVLYAAVLIVWPNFQGVRFILPLLPMYVVFLARGARWLLRTAPQRTRRLAAGMTTIIVVAFYVNFYAHAYYGPIGNGAFDGSSQELFAHIKTSTAPNSVFVFFKPRALALLADRNASAYFSPDASSQLLEYFRSIHTTYVVVGPLDMDWGNRYIFSDPAHFTRVWSNADFSMFQTRLDI